MGGITYSLVNYPLGGGYLLIALSLYAATVWRYPHAPWLLIPALLPILDLSPLTGRFFFDEFDILLLATMALALCRKTKIPPAAWPSKFVMMVLALFTLSVLLAAYKGAWPLQWPDINAFNNYLGPLNGLRAAKGFLWAILFLPILKGDIAKDAAVVYRLLIFGMTLGAALASLVIVIERISFPGAFDFSSSYRVTGPFFAMHNGGAYIEGYLVLSLPFVAWFVVLQRHWAWRIAGLLTFLLGCYCMVMTYARGGYLALVIALMVFAVVTICTANAAQFRARIGLTLVFFGLLGLTAVPVLLNDGYMAGRFSTSKNDLLSRAARWQNGITLMGESAIDKTIGIGSGSYPRLSIANSIGDQPGTYLFVRENQQQLVQLTPGSPLYFEQIVSIASTQTYQIAVSVRARHPSAVLGISVCEKWLLYSKACFAKMIPVGDTAGQFKKIIVEMPLGALPESRWYVLRPIKFSVFNSGSGALDIAETSMRSGDAEILKNGRFDQLMDHWNFSTDRFEHWHFENTWLQLYFEQGMVGIFLFLSLLACAARMAWLRRYEQCFPGAPIAGAAIGFLALGALDSLFDFPRLGFIFYVLIIGSVCKAGMNSLDGKLKRPVDQTVLD